MKNEELKNIVGNIIKIFIYVFTIVILIKVFILIYQVTQAYFLAFGKGFPSSKDVEATRANWGVFGDYFGGVVNPLLGFINFIVLMYTIYLQNRQLTSNDKTQAIQRFEGLFASMSAELSNIYADLIEDLDKKTDLNYTDYKGQKLFINSKKLLNSHPFVFNKKHIQKSLRNQHSLVRYFMYLYQMLKLIDSQDKKHFSFERKKVYSNIIRASIEGNVLQLLYLNTIFIDTEDFEPYNHLVEKYGFFEHMSFKLDDEISPTLIFLAGTYSAKAFDRSVYYRNIISDLLNYYRVTSPTDFYKCKNNYEDLHSAIIIYDYHHKCFKLSNTLLLVEEPILFSIYDFILARTEKVEQTHGITFKYISFNVPANNIKDCILNLCFTSKRTLKIQIFYNKKTYQFHKQSSSLRLISPPRTPHDPQRHCSKTLESLRHLTR